MQLNIVVMATRFSQSIHTLSIPDILFCVCNISIDIISSFPVDDFVSIELWYMNTKSHIQYQLLYIQKAYDVTKYSCHKVYNNMTYLQHDISAQQ